MGVCDSCLWGSILDLYGLVLDHMVQSIIFTIVMRVVSLKMQKSTKYKKVSMSSIQCVSMIEDILK
jgi:hypothetical protein